MAVGASGHSAEAAQPAEPCASMLAAGARLCLLCVQCCLLWQAGPLWHSSRSVPLLACCAGHGAAREGLPQQRSTAVRGLRRWCCTGALTGRLRHACGPV